jgi:uncharacterized membrane protein
MSDQFVANLADFMPDQQGIANMEVIVLALIKPLGNAPLLEFGVRVSWVPASFLGHNSALG